MEKYDKKSSVFKINYEELFNKIATPKFILRFDAIYISILIFLPFVLSLLNWWHFSKITPNQMLAYVGSMTSAFCTINLALLTYSFNVASKKENESLRKRTFIFGEISKKATLDLGNNTLRLYLPLKIVTDNIRGKITYSLKSIKFVCPGEFEETFFQVPNRINVDSIKKSDTNLINIIVNQLNESKVTHHNLIIVHINIGVVNDGHESQNNLIIWLYKDEGTQNGYTVVSESNL